MTKETELSPSQFRIWFDAARPKTLPASFVPVVLGTAIASSSSSISGWVFLLILATAISIQISTNFVNDLYDFLKGADNEARTGPKRATQAGLVTPAQMRLASIIALGLAAFFGALLSWIGGWPLLVIGIVSLYCAVAYTAGPYPLAYLGLGDIFVLIFFGPVAVAGTSYVFTQEWSFASIIAGLGVGAISTAILAVNNLRDFETDTIANKKTLVVRFGKLFGKVEYIALLVAAAIAPLLLYFLTEKSFLILLPMLFLFVAQGSIRNVLREENLNATLAKTGLLLVIYGLLFSLAWCCS